MIEEIKKRLILDGINFINFNKVATSSGQKEVYYVDTLTEKLMLKIVDVTPQILLDEPDYIWDEELKQEIAKNSYRISQEIELSKKCTNFPQIKKINGKDYINYIRLNKKIYLFYLEEKFEGVTLDSILDTNKEFSMSEILDFLLQMGNHIQIMNNKGYVHRDIKPNNIIVNNSTYYLIDGGICKDTNENINATLTGSTIGTKRYLAPEQEKITKNYNWTFQTDLYPLGIIATEMLNKKARKYYLPDESIRNLHTIKELWISKNNSEINKKIFKNIIVSIMNNVRALRFNSIDEFLKAVENIKKEVI